ncbi:MAG: hypothetical protein ACETVZ_06440 [Phycisphaerae bacterium]
MEPTCFSHCRDMEPLCVVFLCMFLFFVALIGIAITLLIWCKLFSKAGYSWALGLLLLVPIANIIMPFFLAFADWPIRKELRRLKQQQGKS